MEMTDPILTRAQDEVAECMAQGWPYKRIADWLGITESTVRVHVLNIALQLPDEDDDDVRPYQRVFLWAAHRRWIRQHPDPKDSIA